MKSARSASFAGLRPASAAASSTKAKVAREKTRCERLLISALSEIGLKFETHLSDIGGRPDIAFRTCKVAIFCDGDFWHGRNWLRRRRRLRAGHNPDYWTKKISRNMSRDQSITRRLRRAGWGVLRIWESRILQDPAKEAGRIAQYLERRKSRRVACSQQTRRSAGPRRPGVRR